jgi:hypothetical protein
LAAAELTLYDPVVFIGFPKNWPVVSSWQDVDFRAVTSLALVHRVRTDEFICQLDPAYVEQYLVGWDEVPEADIRGMSGGPAFLVRNAAEKLLAPQLCGIVRARASAPAIGSYTSRGWTRSGQMELSPASQSPGGFWPSHLRLRA